MYNLIGQKIKKPHRIKMLNEAKHSYDIKFNISHSFSGTPREYSNNMINNGIKYSLLINRSIFNDLSSNPWHKEKYWPGTGYDRPAQIWPAESVFLESYNPDYMKILGPCDNNTYIKRMNDMNIKLNNSNIKIGHEYICIALDRIGGWYLKEDIYKKKLKRLVKLIRNYSNKEIQIRLHPKNRLCHNESNIKYIDYITNELNLKINEVNIDTLCEEAYCIFTMHTYLAYSLLINNKIVFNLEQDCFYNNYVYNENNLNNLNNLNLLDKNNYLQSREKLFKIIINQTIFIDGSEGQQLVSIIDKYMNLIK